MGWGHTGVREGWEDQLQQGEQNQMSADFPRAEGLVQAQVLSWESLNPKATSSWIRGN